MKERLFDSLHGFIHLSHEERSLLDHRALTRLHYLHQLGLTYLVYPGATHSRFEHTLGVMHLASSIYDQLFQVPDLKYKQALRIGALCHDLGHLPFSHTAEKALLGDQGHEHKTADIILWLAQQDVFAPFNRLYEGFSELVLKIALSPEVFLARYPQCPYSDDERILSQIVSGDYFGADRIDYLMRDSRCTGVNFGLFDFPQLIEMLTIHPVQGRPTIVLKEEGLSAAEGLLLARRYMHERVYKHPTVLAYNQTLNLFIQKAVTLNFKQLCPESYLRYSDTWLTELFLQASFDPQAPGYAEALILVKKRAKMLAKPQVILETLKSTPLWVLKKDQTLQPFLARSRAESFLYQLSQV